MFRSGYIYIISLVFLFSCHKDEIAPEQKDEFIKYYGVALNDEGKSLMIEENGDYLILASVNTTDQAKQIALIRTDQYGNVKAPYRYYGSEFNDEAYDLLSDGNGGYYILGSTQRTRQGNLDIYLLHIDAQGAVIWESKYGSQRDDVAYEMVISPSQEIVVAGYSDSLALEGNRVIIASFEASTGNNNWTRLHGRDQDYVGLSIAATNDGYLIGGKALDEKKDPTSYSAIYMKTNLFGLSQGISYIVQDNDSEISSICKTLDGQFVLSGTNFGDNSSTGHVILRKISEDFSITWDKNIEYGFPVVASCVKEQNNRLYVSNTVTIGTTSKASISEISGAGELIEVHEFMDKVRASVQTFSFTPEGHILMVGSNQTGEDVSMIYLLKTALSGGI